MKLSTKIILPIILISAMLILLNGCMGTVPDEDPGYTPGTTTIFGIIAAPCCSTSSTAVSDAPSDWCLQCEQNWFLQKNIVVILTYEGEEIDSTTTNTQGEYTFTDLSAGENYVITAICPEDGGYPLVKDVVKEVADGEDYDAGITDCESTALGLIVDALVNLGISSEFIILEDIQSSVQFKSFVEAVCEVLESCGDVTSDDDLLDLGNLVLMEILGDNPGWTGGEVICVFNPPDDPCIGVPDPTVGAGPDQGFVVCPGTNELVDLVGSGSGKGTLSYAWDLDNDGQFDDSAVQNPQDVPFGVGVHTVRLRVTDECGSAIDEMVVTITESAAVTADAGPNQSEEVCPGTNASIDFVGSGSGTGALSWSWDFDNGGSTEDSTEQSPSGILFAVGTYDVTLTVTDQCGSISDTMTVAITESAAVTADANGTYGPYEVCPGADALVDLSGSGTGTGILSYAWDLDDDGQYDDSSVQNPQDVPFGVGLHTIGLEVTDDCGTATDETTVEVTESAAVTADANGTYGPYEVCPGADALVDLSGSGTGTGILSYAWDLDDDGQYDDSSVQNPQDVPFGVGLHTIGLEVTDDCGTATDETTVEVTESAAVTADANGTYGPYEVCPGADALVDLSGSGTGTGILSYAWDLDDDGQYDDSSVQNPQDVPFGVGLHTIGLEVTDDCGTATDETTVEVTESAAVTADANGTYGPYEVCPGADALVDLSGSGTGTGILSYAWDLDDDGQYDDSSVQNPQDVPFGVGLHTIGLEVTDDCGTATDETTVEVTESAAVTADANGTYGPYEVCPGADALVDLSGSGTGTGILSYAWDLDDDGQYDDSSVQNPQDVPFGVGLHTIGLEVTDDCGTATDETTVEVTELPALTGATFEGGPIVLCVDQDKDIGSEIIITPEFDGVPGTPMTLDECVNSCGDCTCSIAITPPDMGNFSISGPTNLYGLAEGVGYITITYSYDGPCGLEFVDSDPIEVVVEADAFFLIDNKGGHYGLDIDLVDPCITVVHNANHVFFGVSACIDPETIVEFKYDRSHCGGGVSEYIRAYGGIVDPTMINLCNGDSTFLWIRIGGTSGAEYEFEIYRLGPGETEADSPCS